MKYSAFVKAKLEEKIQEMGEDLGAFVMDPKRDFIRNRKLPFETMVKLLFSMESGSLNSELLKHFNYAPDTASVSAFNQQRGKILPRAFQFLFHEFNRCFPREKTYRGYHLLACDGSDINIAHNPQDADNHFKNRVDRNGFNQLHILFLDRWQSVFFPSPFSFPQKVKPEVF